MKGKNTKNTKKTNQSERISIRCTKKVKDDFTRRMKKGRYETQVEFIVDALKTMDDKEKIERNNAHFCCVMQDILNHWNTSVDPDNGIRFDRPKDNYIENKVEELWKIIY